MKICAISDTHNYPIDKLLDGIEADVLIHAGDFTLSGTRSELLNFSEQLKLIRSQFKEILVLSGNHELSLGSSDRMERLMAETYIKDSGARYLKDELLELEGKKLWFSPWIPQIGREPYWAWESTRGNEIAKHWKKIPENLDVLVCHTMPYGILDWEINWNEKKFQYGCYDLKDRLTRQLKNPPKVFIGGHIHKDNVGQDFYQGEKTKFYNVACMNNAYIYTWPPVVIEI